MSEIVNYISIAFAGIGVVYSAVIHFLHKNNSKITDINSTIKF